MTKEYLDELLKTAVLMAHFRLVSLTMRKDVPIGGAVYYWTVWPEAHPDMVFLLYGKDSDPKGTPVDVAPLSEAAHDRMTALGKEFSEWLNPLAMHEQFAFSLRVGLRVSHYERPKAAAFATHLPN